MAGLGLDISPGEYASSLALGGTVNFAPVSVGTASTKDRAINVAGLIALAVVVIILMRRK